MRRFMEWSARRSSVSPLLGEDFSNGEVLVSCVGYVVLFAAMVLLAGLAERI